MADNEQAVPGYIAFISYSREDEAFAKQLETEIEAYQRPGTAASARIFRDRSDFTGSAYESALDGHLQNSKSLIVLCSPHARKSDFVGDEIRRFARHHGTDRIFPILVSGLPDNEADDKKAFPAALLEVMQGSGIPLGAEYRGLDLRKERVNAGRFEGEWYKLLGNIYGVTPAEIRAEDTSRLTRVQRRRFLIAAGIGVLLLACFVGALLLWCRAKAAEEEAVRLRKRAELLEQQADDRSAKAETELSHPEKEKQERAVEQEVVRRSSSGTPTADKLSARVYVHVRNEEQKALAQRWTSGLQQELQNAGLRAIVPDIDVLDVGPTKTSELRFFRAAEKADAARIAEAIRAKPGMSDLVVKLVPGYEDSPKIRPRHFELWIKSPSTS
jgi:hypothetical protein